MLAITMVAVPVRAQSVREQYQRAAQLYEGAQFAEAARELARFVQQYPSDPWTADATFYCGEALVQIHDYAEALPWFERYLKRADSTRSQHVQRSTFRIGQCAYFTQKPEMARQWLERFHRDFPQDPLNAFALPYLAELTQRANNLSLAKSYFEEALQSFAQGEMVPECHYGLATIAESSCDWGTAQREYTAAVANDQGRVSDRAYYRLGLLQYGKLHDPEMAKQSFAKVVAEYPTSSLFDDASYWLSVCRMSQGDFSQAAAGFAGLLQRRSSETGVPATTAQNNELLAAACYYLGECYRRNKQWNDAEKAFATGMEDWPDSQWLDDYHCGRTLVLLGQQQWDEAQRAFAALRAAAPDSKRTGELRRALGHHLVAANQYARAADLLQAELQDPDAIDVQAMDWYLVAIAELGHKQYDACLSAIGRTVSATRPSTMSLPDNIHVIQGLAYLGTRQFGPAEQAFAEYLQQPRAAELADVARARANLAIALAGQQKFAQATTAYEQYIDNHPQDPAILLTTMHLAELAYEAGDRQSARPWFTRLATDGQSESHRARGRSGLAWCDITTDAPHPPSPATETNGIGTNGGSASELAHSQPPALHPARTESTNQPPDTDVGSSGDEKILTARAMEQRGDTENALNLYRDAMTDTSASQRHVALLRGAVLARDAQQYVAAIQWLSEFLTTYADHERVPEALFERAWLYAEEGETEQSLADFRRIYVDFASSPHWPDAAFRLAQHAAANRQTGEVEHLVNSILQQDPHSDVAARALFLTGQIAAADGRWHDTEQIMRRLTTSFPPNELIAIASYWLAESLYRQSRWSDAQQELQRQIKEDALPRSWHDLAMLRLAQSLAHQRNWKDAESIAKQLHEAAPDFEQDYEVDYLLGRCQAAQARFHDARQSYRRVTTNRNPHAQETAAMAQWMIGESFMHQQQYDEAILAFQAVEVNYPLPRWQSLALLEIGACYEAIGDHRAAVAAYAQVMQQFPASTTAQDASQRLEKMQTQTNPYQSRTTTKDQTR
ncbi:MAG: tetratricopeptide repeat protein [Pirellulaceae bacterium]